MAYLVVCPEDDCMRKREVAYLEWVVVDGEEQYLRVVVDGEEQYREK